MASRIITCPKCGAEVLKPNSAINRAIRSGLSIYCSRECAGIARRREITTEDKKLEKRLYDMERRQTHKEKIKAQKAAYYREHHDREKERIERKKRSAQHVEYCRRPEYREWKAKYDRQYRARKFFGEFAECHLLVISIRDKCLERMDDTEIRLTKGTMNKKLQRRRDYERTFRDELEDRPLGDA